MGLILITHDLRVAFAMCDRVYVMYAGVVVETGTADDIDHEPLHPYSQGLLLSEPPAEQRVAELVAIPGSVPPADEVAGECPFASRCAWVKPECRDGPAAAPGARLRTCNEVHPDRRDRHRDADRAFRRADRGGRAGARRHVGVIGRDHGSEEGVPRQPGTRRGPRLGLPGGRRGRGRRSRRRVGLRQDDARTRDRRPGDARRPDGSRSPGSMLPTGPRPAPQTGAGCEAPCR